MLFKVFEWDRKDIGWGERRVFGFVDIHKKYTYKDKLGFVRLNDEALDFVEKQFNLTDYYRSEWSAHVSNSKERKEYERKFRDTIEEAKTALHKTTKVATMHPTYSGLPHKLVAEGSISYGLLNVELNKRKKTLMVSYGGNMGSSFDRDVNPSLLELGLGTIDELTSTYEVIRKEGHPAYMFELELKLVDNLTES